MEIVEFCSWCLKKVVSPNYVSKIRANGEKVCWNCYKPSLKDGYLTRNSERSRHEQEKHRADFVQPHIYDKGSRRLIPNKEFLRLYPDKARFYFTEDDMVKSGRPKFAQYMKRQKQAIKKEQVEFKGNAKRKLRKIIK